MPLSLHRGHPTHPTPTPPHTPPQDEIDLAGHAEAGRLRLSLVDHNELAPKLIESLGECVVEIVDHHQDAGGHAARDTHHSTTTANGVAPRSIGVDLEDSATREIRACRALSHGFRATLALLLGRLHRTDNSRFTHIRPDIRWR